MQLARLDGTRGVGRRAAVLAVLGGAVLLAHLGVIDAFDRRPPEPSAHSTAVVITLLPAAATVAPTVPAAPAEPPATAVDRPRSSAVEPLTATPRQVADRRLSRRAALAPLRASTAAAIAVATDASSETPDDTRVVVPATPAPAADATPSYPTQPPPSATLNYRVRRGAEHGSAALHWQAAVDRYAVQLDADLAGAALLRQHSQGGFDAAGLAPTRFTERRARRSLQAANFEREAGTVSFSGPSTVVDLAPGAQDHLSWMLQLAAVVAADPARSVPGATVRLHVVEARGGATVWTLRCVGREAVHVEGGDIAAERFERESNGPYDLAVDVWLDPLRHHLPVRARWRPSAGGDALEFELDALTWTP